MPARVSCLANTFLCDEGLLLSGKAPRRVIARYGEERQRSMTATDTVTKEQYLRDRTLDSLQVFQALNRSPNARLEHSAELGDGMAAALWSNHHDAQDYEAPSHHTLSCYIAGGTGTFRRDQPGTKGGPDKLCILPADHQSGWVINGDIRLAHLYFSPEQFALGCVTLLDREPRELQLREGTFLDDPQQARRFRQMLTLNWNEPGERLLTSSLAHEMLSHVLLGQVGMRDGLRLKGGLAAHQRRQLVEFIDNQLAEAISLGQLAGLCALSEYHFCLLYTSPSPRDRTRSRMPSSA